MPLFRYFVVVGGVLLALLFVADAVLPTQTLPSFLNVASADRPVVRIHSERKWPERIVFDTSAPIVRPSVIAEAAPAEARPAQVAGLAANPLVREAFAQLVTPVSAPESRNEAKTVARPEPAVAKVSETKPKRKVAKARPSHPMVLVAQQPHIGWFDSTW